MDIECTARIYYHQNRQWTILVNIGTGRGIREANKVPLTDCQNNPVWLYAGDIVTAYHELRNGAQHNL